MPTLARLTTFMQINPLHLAGQAGNVCAMNSKHLNKPEPATGHAGSTLPRNLEVHKQYLSVSLHPQLYDVVTKRQDGEDIIIETVAENCSQGDAEAIVQACTCHLELLNALKQILDLCHKREHACLQTPEAFAIIARQAIAHAERTQL
jgi:hypothetical protein